ncbi:hypothetical protein MIMGU_mgv1a025154mg, partial [Erythranthe guttata]
LEEKMSSEQARRENHVRDERKIEVEKDRVPKMTTHFESLAEKTKGDQDTLPHHHHVERVSVPVRVGGVQYSSSVESHDESDKIGPHKEDKQAPPSLEEISKMRGAAQQNSLEAIRAAEDRYNKAKDQTTTGHGQAQGGGGIQTRTQTQTNKGGGGAFMEKTQQQPQEAKDVISSQGHQPKDVTAPKAAAAALMEKTQQAKEYAAHKATEAKDVISSKSGTAMEKAQQAKGVIAPKAAALKDIALEKGQTAAQYAAEKAKAAKDTAVDTSMVAAQYAGEKAVAAKDVTVESGKGAAGYAGKVAVGVKDQAVVAGWGAAHYTLEKVAEATKTVAGVTSSVAGYTGEKAVVAKDKVAGVGQTVVGYAGDTIAAVKDAVVSTEEKAAEFTARKKADAEKELSEEIQGGEAFPGKEEHGTRGKTETESEKVKEYSHGGGGEEWGQKIQHEESDEQEQQGGGGGGGGVFQAIGETIVEIGQTTKDLLVGQYPSADVMEKPRHESKGDPQPYAGAGEGI